MENHFRYEERGLLEVLESPELEATVEDALGSINPPNKDPYCVRGGSPSESRQLGISRRLLVLAVAVDERSCVEALGLATVLA